MNLIGNAWLAEKFELGDVPLQRRSFVSSYSFERVDAAGEVERGYPKVYAVGDDPLENVAFALKHELPHLELLQRVFRKLSVESVVRYVTTRPSGQYTRQIGFLFEFLTGEQLPLGDIVMTGNYVSVLDDEQLLTSAPRRVQKWRVNDNLLGSPQFCPIVRLTDAVKALSVRNWRNEIDETVKDTPPATLQRALGYLYAKETKSSFLIEREEPGPDRTARFIAALRDAGRGTTDDALSEARMVKLQNTIVDPRYAQSGYRKNQNYVGETLPGLSEHVHYVCPPPQFVSSLMAGLASCLSRMDAAPALAQAAVSAFQFVFVHPFEDGNGRIHRFLLHDILTRRGVLSNGLLLPLSATILQDMKAYDATLEAFSRPLLPRIRYDLSDSGILTVLNPEAVGAAWRFPDLTVQVAYLGEVMDRALEALPAELRFLEQYDTAFAAARDVVDMPDKRLRLLLNLLHNNQGHLARGKRGLFQELTDDELQRIEKAFAEAFQPEV